MFSVFFGKHIVWGVLFPVGKHMRGGAENNEASPRHLPDLLPRKYNTPPSLLPPSPIPIGHERVTTSCEVVALEMDLVDKELRGIRAAQTLLVSRGLDANSAWFFSFFVRFARSCARTPARFAAKGIAPKILPPPSPTSWLTICHLVELSSENLSNSMRWQHKIFDPSFMCLLHQFDRPCCVVEFSSKTRSESVWQESRWQEHYFHWHCALTSAVNYSLNFSNISG